jgi:hypothetical protein
VAKTWVLDTATKGTGASVVPIDRVEKPPAPSGEKVSVVRKPRRKPRPEQRRRRPRRFKIVDVVTRETLAEDVDVRATLGVLRGVRSHIDVHVYVHDPVAATWRLLLLSEQRALWDARDRIADGS